MWFTRISIHNPVFATMMMVAISVLGLFAYNRLNVDQFPDVNFPVVWIATEYPGAAPETVEMDVTRKIEEAVNTISGVKTLRSRSNEGKSTVIIEFDLTVDPVVAAQDVREKIALIRQQFRKEIKEPVVARFNPDDQPILSITISSPNRSLRELTTLADQVIAKRLENIRGVGSAQIVGGEKRQIRVLLDSAAMTGNGIGVDQVIRAIRSENQDLPAGSVKYRNSEQMIELQGRIASVQQFGDLIVARRGSAPVRLSSIARVSDAEEESASIALIDGKRGLSIDIVKMQGANTIDVARRVREELGQLRSELPSDIRLATILDSSTGIEESVENVRNTLFEGALLTILIVFLFLHSWRSTVITGLALPISLIGTFLAIYVFGYTLNVMTLMALSLCIGLLIDDAIVVRENIIRHLKSGKSPMRAALDGTREIGLAVTATTFSIVAVFLPVAFMGGIIGRFFFQFGITVSAAVLLSMFVSFTLDPMLSSRWHDPASAEPRRLEQWVDSILEAMSRRYRDLLGWALAHRKTVVLGAAGIFFGSFLLLPFVGSEFVPEADLSENMVTLTTPPGSTLEYTSTKVAQAEAALREFPEVQYCYAVINAGTATGKNKALIFVHLKPRAERALSQKQLSNLFRERLLRIAGIEVSVGAPTTIGGGKPIQVSVQGPDLDQLQRISAQAIGVIERTPGLVDIESSLQQADPLVNVRINRELASDLGVSIGQIGSDIRPLLAGEAAGTWKAPDGEDYEVNVRLAESERQTESDLGALPIASSLSNPDGSPKIVQLRQIAQFVPAMGASQINRRDLAREVLLTANVYGRPAGDAGQALQRSLGKLQLPPGYRFVMGGSTKDIKETMGYALSALMLAIIFIYLILASQFGSFLQPVSIMASLPLSLAGVLGALLIFGSTLNIFSIIGFIMLMGLVTKNAILLVDFINSETRRGGDRSQAILNAGSVRLRPILMTTLAMIFGMMPLALGIGVGAEQRAPMAHAVIGGIVTSSLLTLVVVPILYTYLDDLAIWIKSKRKGLG